MSKIVETLVWIIYSFLLAVVVTLAAFRVVDWVLCLFIAAMPTIIFAIFSTVIILIYIIFEVIALINNKILWCRGHGGRANDIK